MNLPTLIVLLIVLTMVFFALRFLRMGKGNCSCSKDAKQKVHSSKCASCSANCPLKGK